MRRALLPALLLAAFAVEPALASEASGEHAHAGPDWAYFVYHALGLSVLIGVLVYFMREPLKKFLLERSDGIRRQIESAEAALEAARAEAAELRTRLERIADENAELVRSAAELADAERALALERARQSAERIREESRRAADQEIVRAKRELQEEAAQLATSLAAEILRQGVTPDDDRRILGEFVEQIGRRA